MRIARIDNCAMAEFEDSITTVVFLCGCDMYCPYCHNDSITNYSSDDCEEMSWHDVSKNIKWDVIDWLSFSGGEPLYHAPFGDTLYHAPFGDILGLAREARMRDVKVNMDTNGKITVQKTMRLGIISPFLDCLSVDIKYLNSEWLSGLLKWLRNCDVLDISRFRMVMTSDSFGKEKDPKAAEILNEFGVKRIKILRNSLLGRGAVYPPTPDELIKEFQKYYGDRGIELYE